MRLSPANLTLSSNGSLDHRDMLEGRDGAKGQDSEIPVFAGQPSPAPANHTALSGCAAPSEPGRSTRMSRNSASVIDTQGPTERIADGLRLPVGSMRGPMEQVSVL